MLTLLYLAQSIAWVYWRRQMTQISRAASSLRPYGPRLLSIL
jgi:hypothetical protein